MVDVDLVTMTSCFYVCSSSSVPIPKDISYFRNEREMILKRGLQVNEALNGRKFYTM